MLSAFFNGLKTLGRRPTHPRLDRRASRPLLEPMEDRCLLTTYMLVDSPGITEGTGGTSEIKFTVTLSTPSTKQVSVNYRTIDSSSKAGQDYHAKVGTLTFDPGQTRKTISVGVVGDSNIEQTEAFYLYLSGATNATLLQSLKTGVIVDDDAPIAPKLSIDDVAMQRGFDGSKLMTFTVSLNTKLNTSVSVKASTRNVTALAGLDYEATSRTLTFAPGETTKQVTVKIFGKSTIVSDKVFYVDLTNASVSLVKSTGAGILRYGA